MVIREEQRSCPEGPASASYHLTWAKWSADDAPAESTWLPAPTLSLWQSKLPASGLLNGSLARSHVIFKQKHILYTPRLEFPTRSVMRHALSRVTDILHVLQTSPTKDKSWWPLVVMHGNVLQSQNLQDNLLTTFSFPPLRSKINLKTLSETQTSLLTGYFQLHPKE